MSRVYSTTIPEEQQNMEKHVSLVGTLTIVYHALSVLGAGFLFLLAAYFGHFFESFMSNGYIHPHEVPMELLDIVPVILVIVSTCLLVISVCGIFGGIGVLRRKEWARLLLLVISFFTLVRVPLGTVLGIYTIWVLFNDETIRLFKPARHNEGGTGQPKIT